MRILVLAQKGDWTACESALKALERNVVEELLKDGHKQPLAKISDTVSYLILDRYRIFREIVFVLYYYFFFSTCDLTSCY